MRIKDLGEIRLIERLARGMRYDRSVVKGIGDDTAVLKWTAGRYLLFTCDMSIEDVHFRLRSATPYQIGWKALGRNISDIAAMGGEARYALVSLGIPPSLPARFVDGLYRGMRDLARRFGVAIVGGDTSRSEKVVVDVALIGAVEKRRLVLRSGAKPGDVIMVTGSLGGSIKGKHLAFTPRIVEARRLTGRFKVSAMIDISDGLLIDLKRVLDASSVGARLYKNAIPLSRDAVSFERAVADGEDFELLFTMRAAEARRFFLIDFPRMKTPVSVIGEVMRRSDGYTLVGDDGHPRTIRTKGYTHF